MFKRISFPSMPPMPQIADFQKVCEDPDWVAEHYQQAMEIWRDACVEWQKACAKISDAVSRQTP